MNESFSRSLTPEDLRRLALIRRLYDIGLEQSNAPGAVASLAILTFHDSVELFLQLAAEHHDIGTKRPDFMQYWDLLKSAGVNLPQRVAMKRLNTARVCLKHDGILPDAESMQSFRTAVTNLLREGISLTLGIDFDQISLVDLIQDQDIRDNLARAQGHLEDQNYEGALTEAAMAFTRGLNLQEKRIAEATGSRTPFILTDVAQGRLRFFSRFNAEDAFGPAGARVICDLHEAMSQMADLFSQVITVVGFHLDLKSYLLFKSHIPVVINLIGGKMVCQWMEPATNDPRIVEHCIRFVTNTVLQFESPRLG